MFLRLQFVFHCHPGAFLFSSKKRTSVEMRLFYHGKTLLEGSRLQPRFRGTRTMLYTPVSCGTGHFSRGISIGRERLLELCFGQQIEWNTAGTVRQNERMNEKEWETKRENWGIFEGGRRLTKERSGSVKQRQRCTDDQTKYPRVEANDYNWGTNRFN